MFFFPPQQFSLLQKLLDAAHENQFKELESRHDKESADLRKKQVKQSVETSKMAEKQIKSKDEKERWGSYSLNNVNGI